MDFIIANVEHIEFKIERDLNEQYGSLPLPFPGMDSKYLVFAMSNGLFKRNKQSEVISL